MSIQLIGLPRFDFGDRVTLNVNEGCSIVEMIAIAMPELLPEQYGRLRVTINDAVLEPRFFRALRPKSGTCVVIRVQLGGDNLRSVLAIAVTVAAIAVGQLYLGPLLANAAVGSVFGGGMFFGGAAGVGLTSLFSSVATAGLAIGGSLLLNALIPPRQSGQAGGDKSLQSIQGLQNNLALNGAVPLVLGFFRYAPPYASRPSTEIVDNDQFVSAGFVFGHGELDISEVKLGETPIGSFTDVDYEVLSGTDADDPMAYCLSSILEESLGVQLLSLIPNTRLTASDISAFAIDLLFPQGLVQYDDKGHTQTFGVGIGVRWRLLGDVTWSSQIIEVYGESQDPIRRTFTFSVATRGKYEVEVTRGAKDFDATVDKVFARSDWTTLRSHRPEYPINFEFPLALLSLRMKATDQLNGVVNNLNAIVKSIVLDFDGTAWTRQVSNNPASLFRHVLQCAANAYPVGDDGIILGDLEDWHGFCVTNGLTYNAVRDTPAALLDVLADVASAGRATPQIIGGKWTVVVDRPQTQLVSAISARNSSGFAGSIEFVTFPDAYRVAFFDEENGYESTERIIPWPGVLLANVKVTEDLSLPGKTNATEIFIEARRRQFEAIYLRESFTVTQDIEGLVYTRGDLTALSHDVLDRTQVAARIRSIRGGLVEIDDLVTMEPGTTYGARVRKADGSVVQFAVSNVDGESRIVQLVGDVAASAIAVGDLLMFGSMASVTTNCRIKSIDRGDNQSVNLALIPYLPIIDDLTSQIVVPAWDGRFGEIYPLPPPSIPLISAVETKTGPVTVIAHIVSGGGTASARSYTVAHRISGVGSFTEMSVSAGAGAASITGYSLGDTLDLKVKAIGRTGSDSGYGAVTTYIVHIGPTFDTTAFTFDSTNITWDSL